MEALKRKWNSCRGASILLALLFLLVCMMAGASVVMAAASNAGKIRSNKEEQQKYLAATSALMLLCDEIQSMEYVGHYTITTETESKFTTYTYAQKDGLLRPRTDDDGNILSTTDDWNGENGLIKILPLLDNWEYVFAEQFEGEPEIAGYGNAEKQYEPVDYDTSTLSNSYDLTFPYYMNNTDDVDDMDEEGKKDVEVTVTVSGRDEADAIILRASVDGLVVRATLVPADNKGPSKLELPEPYDTNIEKNKDAADGTIWTDPVRWELEEIVKVGGVTNEETP